MENKREELARYVDSCLEYNIPINRFTYFWFRLSNGFLIRDLIMSVQRKISIAK